MAGSKHWPGVSAVHGQVRQGRRLTSNSRRAWEPMVAPCSLNIDSILDKWVLIALSNRLISEGRFLTASGGKAKRTEAQ